MLKNVEKLTDEEMEALAFAINLIFHRDFEIVNENVVVIKIFAEAVGRFSRPNMSS